MLRFAFGLERPSAFARTVFWTAALAVVLSLGGKADASQLVAGGNFPTINIIYTPIGSNEFSSGAGSINQSYLDGRALPYLYCVDIETDINVPGTYNTTDVTQDGKIRGNYVGGSASAAGRIAWLLNHYGSLAVSRDQQGGLQAAIWKVEYGNLFTLTANNSAATLSFYNTALTALGSNSDPLDSILWLSPWNDAARTSPAQGLITSAVPEPSTIASALAGLGFVLARRVRRSR